MKSLYSYYPTLFFLSIFCSQFALCKATLTDTSIGKVVALSGQTHIKDSKVEVKVGDPVYDHTHFLTEDESSVRVRFHDGAAIELGPKADLVIDAPHKKNQTWNLQLIQGYLYSFVRSALSSKKIRYRVHTRDVVMGVRGTHFFANASPSESFVCICKGKVEVSSKKGKEKPQVFESKHHDFARVISEDGKIEAAKDIIDHSDDIAKALEITTK